MGQHERAASHLAVAGDQTDQTASFSGKPQGAWLSGAPGPSRVQSHRGHPHRAPSSPGMEKDGLPGTGAGNAVGKPGKSTGPETSGRGCRLGRLSASWKQVGQSDETWDLSALAREV